MTDPRELAARWARGDVMDLPFVLANGGVAALDAAVPFVDDPDARRFLIVTATLAASERGLWSGFAQRLRAAASAARALDDEAARQGLALARQRWLLASDQAAAGRASAARLTRLRDAYLAHVGWHARGLWALRAGDIEEALACLTGALGAYERGHFALTLTGPMRGLCRALHARATIAAPLRDYDDAVAQWARGHPLGGFEAPTDVPEWMITH